MVACLGQKLGQFPTYPGVSLNFSQATLAIARFSRVCKSKITLYNFGLKMIHHYFETIFFNIKNNFSFEQVT